MNGPTVTKPISILTSQIEQTAQSKSAPASFYHGSDGSNELKRLMIEDDDLLGSITNPMDDEEACDSYQNSGYTSVSTSPPTSPFLAEIRRPVKHEPPSFPELGRWAGEPPPGENHHPLHDWRDSAPASTRSEISRVRSRNCKQPKPEPCYRCSGCRLRRPPPSAPIPITNRRRLPDPIVALTARPDSRETESLRSLRGRSRSHQRIDFPEFEE
ncbi:hypothetical protein M011DRAFT_456634 [Sporormia fimetaria CBS 119925]|uniref:Uncharacterized protein n=1 Tax=Sporormia fimetaria CBS 119925 TaxID=1340428 RepID=A0A6A6VL84_9PLEO|nr:hypothetical protein M011DRAFT_456634 [Sporormia fimetaria CBS 119925]